MAVNNPLKFVDTDGRDIIVLLAPGGANNFGHVAVMIGNDDAGWRYVSKDGTDDDNYLIKNVIGESKYSDDKIARVEDINSKINIDRDNKYTMAYRIAADADTDSKMYAAALASAKLPYLLIGANCADVVSAAWKKVAISGSVLLADHPIPTVKSALLMVLNSFQLTDVLNGDKSEAQKKKEEEEKRKLEEQVAKLIF